MTQAVVAQKAPYKTEVKQAKPISGVHAENRRASPFATGRTRIRVLSRSPIRRKKTVMCIFAAARPLVACRYVTARIISFNRRRVTRVDRSAHTG